MSRTSCCLVLLVASGALFLTATCNAAIAPEIRTAEQQRVSRKPPGNLTSYDQILRAMAAINRIPTRKS